MSKIEIKLKKLIINEMLFVLQSIPSKYKKITFLSNDQAVLHIAYKVKNIINYRTGSYKE